MRLPRRFPLAVLGLALCLGLPAAARAAIPARPTPVPWIHDDFDGALKLARQRHVPVFVNLGAPWCHTCRSMDAYVLGDSSVARHAAGFVWLELDSEKPANAKFCRTYPKEGVPSFYVIDPASGHIIRRWLGGLTIPQLHALLDESTAAAPESAQLQRRVAVADSLYGAPDYPGAARAFESLLGDAPAGWSHAPRLVESLLFAYQQQSDHTAAIALADRWLPVLGRSVSALNVSSGALEDAIALADTGAARTATIARFEASTRDLVRDTTYLAAADDRSGAWISIVDARDDAHDPAGKREAASAWAGLLEEAAARASSPEQRAVFDPHRLSAYLELGQPERAVPMLQQSERDLPDDYNPPARLAMAYLNLKLWDDALAASDRAMAKAYGPRKLLYYSTRADIFDGRGDRAGARRTLQEAVAYGETLPDGQRPKGTLDRLRARLAALAAN